MVFGSMTVGKRLHVGFGLMLAILVAVTSVGVFKVQAINDALEANSAEHAAIQRYAINFRGSAHDRAIAVRDVVLSRSAADLAQEVATIAKLASFYADSAGPLEKLLQTSPDAAQLRRLYGAIQDIESKALATTRAVVERVEAGDTEPSRST